MPRRRAFGTALRMQLADSVGASVGPGIGDVRGLPTPLFGCEQQSDRPRVRRPRVPLVRDQSSLDSC